MKYFDDCFRSDKIKLIAGIDEAGRGSLAGPVVAASVILPVDFLSDEINDSKKINAAKREKLFDLIVNNCISYNYEVISPEEIDEINILQATLKAMYNSADKLSIKPNLLLVDGNKTFEDKIPTVAVIDGDEKSLSIAAASIIAKVIRDRIMVELDKNYPEYGWSKNKGYGTKRHIEAIKENGISPYHRKTFTLKFFGL